ncbi:MAG: LPS export ABC transporter permease LptG [Sphingomonadales bacterium]|nr:LPS export ABC transporter permease LptG [Sphingomonadales bacterium]
MQLEFFPSRTLALYLARLFATRILGVLVMLVLVLQLLDLLGESGKILAAPGNGEPQLWSYVLLRLPQLVSRFLPYSVLLATLLTFWPLNQNSEVIAMRAAGLSAHQILAPLLVTALLVAAVAFGFNERVVTRASATLKAWQAVDYGPLPQGEALRGNVYVGDGPDILAADNVSGEGAAMQLSGVTWYLRDPQGFITSETHGTSARFVVTGRNARGVTGGWQLTAPTRFDTSTLATGPAPPGLVATGVTPAQIEISTVDADAESFSRLARSIDTLRANGRRTAELDGKWWHKISGPLSALLMPLLGAVAAFGLARSGQLFIRAVIGMALGFAYFVIDNAALAIGNFGGYPPLIAAWGPFLLFLLVGETVLIRTEE